MIRLIGSLDNRCSIVPSQHLPEVTQANYENISQDIHFQISVAMGVEMVVFWVVTWVYYCQWTPTFWRCMLSLSSGSKSMGVRMLPCYSGRL